MNNVAPMDTELAVGRVDPWVGSGRVGSGRVQIIRLFCGSGWVGSISCGSCWVESRSCQIRKKYTTINQIGQIN